MNSESLHSLSAKVNALADVYARLKAARTRLRELVAADGTAPAGLAAEVNQLEIDCGKAADDLQAAYANMKTTRPSGDSL